MKQIRTLILALGSGLLAAQASAAVQYSYITDTPSVQTSPLSLVQVNIYLQEQVSGGDSSLLLQEGGLFGAGVSVQRTGALPVQPASVSSLVANVGAGGFDGAVKIVNVAAMDAEGYWDMSFGAASGMVGTDMGGGLRRVLLGTVSVQAGSTAGTTSFTIGGYQDNTVTFNNIYDLDAGSSDTPAFGAAQSTAFSVTTTVPEPSLLGGIVLLGLLARRRVRTDACVNCQ